MREIVFKGKRIDNDEWVEGSYCHAEKLDRSGDEHFIIEYSANDSSYRVSPETVGQYTGLKDKNGKRIFEGDVVSYKRVHQFTEDDDIEDYGNQFPDKISDCLGVVEFRNGKFMPLPERHDCDDYWYSDGQYGFEVIGNIHDNPELMEER